MTKNLNLHSLFVSITIAVAATACGKPGAAKTEKIEGVEWNVTVREALPFHDPSTGVNTDARYTVADTAAINQKLLGIKPENLTLEWTIPSADGSIWLVAYENGELLSEKVTVTEANTLPSYDGDIQIAFKFPDPHKWEEITQENIGKRLALFVNGQLMNAPQVNCPITSGNCSVTLPPTLLHSYLPALNLDPLPQ